MVLHKGLVLLGTAVYVRACKDGCFGMTGTPYYLVYYLFNGGWVGVALMVGVMLEGTVNV